MTLAGAHGLLRSSARNKCQLVVAEVACFEVVVVVVVVVQHFNLPSHAANFSAPNKNNEFRCLC